MFFSKTYSSNVRESVREREKGGGRDRERYTKYYPISQKAPHHLGHLELILAARRSLSSFSTALGRE